MPMLQVNGLSTALTGLAVVTNSDYNLATKNAYGLSVQAVYTDGTTVAKTVASTDVNITTGAITKAAHGLSLGAKGQLTTTSALPTGFSTSTDYFVIYLTAGTFGLASSLANAIAGTIIIPSDQGTGNHTFTPTALNQVVKLQCSNDGTNFMDISGKTVTVTAAGNTLWDLGTPFYKILRTVVTPTAGTLNLTLVYNAVNAA